MILIVLITILFATLALTVFIEKASNDLLVDARQADANRLRLEAFSALETTLGVLEDFRLVLGALHSPSEGWGDPLDFAGYTPGEGRTIDIQFVDESAKVSLPKASPTQLVDLFKSWGLMQNDAEKLRDALLGWMQKDYVPSSASSPRAEDYDRGDLPIAPPGRLLRSFQELASIEYARTVFYDENGEPNPLWHRFVEAFSLFAYDKANINGGNPEALAALGITDEGQRRRVADYIHGTGSYARQGPGYFKNAGDVGTILGGNSPASELSTQISALRIIITVWEGHSSYRLNAVVAPQGGATIAATNRSQTDATKSGDQVKQNNTQAAVPKTSAAAGMSGGKSLNYPFTILEIRENDEVASTPTGSPEETP